MHASDGLHPSGSYHAADLRHDVKIPVRISNCFPLKCKEHVDWYSANDHINILYDPIRHFRKKMLNS